MRVASIDVMKHALLALGLLSLGGCGSILNLATGPQVYGGVQVDLDCAQQRCTAGLGYLDLPFSAVLDTGLLPVTAIFEGIRAATGWPPRTVE